GRPQQRPEFCDLFLTVCDDMHQHGAPTLAMSCGIVQTQSQPHYTFNVISISGRDSQQTISSWVMLASKRRRRSDLRQGAPAGTGGKRARSTTAAGRTP